MLSRSRKPFICGTVCKADEFAAVCSRAYSHIFQSPVHVRRSAGVSCADMNAHGLKTGDDRTAPPGRTVQKNPVYLLICTVIIFLSCSEKGNRIAYAHMHMRENRRVHIMAEELQTDRRVHRDH